jgi:DHA1 family tetracycline resistance protein-like MFS transporter
MNQRRAGLAFILVTILIDVLGLGLLIPILPELVKEFAGGDYSTASSYYGWFIAVYAAMQFLFAPVLGALSDRYGRRPVILVSLLGAGIDYLLMALAPTLGWLFGMGFILGPALGGLLGNYGLRVPFYFAAALVLLNWLYGYFILPESHKPENRQAFSWTRANPVGSVAALGRYPIVLGLTVTLICAHLAHQALQSTWVLYTAYRYAWSPLQNGLSLALVGILSVLVQGGLVRVLIPRLGERRAIVAGLAVTMLAFLLYGLATQGWMIYAIMVIGSLGGIAGPALQGLISRSVSDQEQGSVQGALASLASLTGVVGPVVATGLFANFTAPGAPVHLPGIAFFFGALLILAGTLFAVRLFKQPRTVAASFADA